MPTRACSAQHSGRGYGQQRSSPRSTDLGMLDLGSDQQWPAGMLIDRGSQASAEPRRAVGPVPVPRRCRATRPRRNTPPGAGARPAKASARPRCCHPSRLTAKVEPAEMSGGKIAVLVDESDDHRWRPSATKNDDTVQPARRCPPSPPRCSPAPPSGPGTAGSDRAWFRRC